MPKTYFIKTLGCQANIADSETFAGILESLGLERVTEAEGKSENEKLYKTLQNTDLFIVNTCSVRQKSEDKVYGLGKLTKKLIEKSGEKPFIVLAGCMVGSVTGERQRYEMEKLKKKTPWADLYINPHQIMELPDLLVKNGALGRSAIKNYNADKIEASREKGKHAYVNISYGCDNFCTYCVVPYARGKEISRSQEEILKEVTNLATRGYSEITLCGQNVNSWGLETKEKFEIRTGSNQKLPFADLLRKIQEIEDVEKIDFLSSNPFDFTSDLIDAIQLPKISNYIHIAAQSGNNEVLKRMNRRHTIEDFVKLVDEIRKVKPKLELGTDIIVGFPGETREQFMDTIKLFEKVKFNVAFISIYSSRIGTTAQKLYKDDITLKEKKWRHAELTRVWRNSLKKKPASMGNLQAIELKAKV